MSPAVSAACAADLHETFCTARGCACGCHWLMPLVRGDVDQAVSASGRAWVKADLSTVQAGGPRR